MIDISTKEKLYIQIDRLKLRDGLEAGAMFNPFKYAERHDIEIELAVFKTAKLCGAAFVSEPGGMVIINSIRSELERRFDLCHELVHVIFHRENSNRFVCLENGAPEQNEHLEWQANEGAAELLIHWKQLLHETDAFPGLLEYPYTRQAFYNHLCSKFAVTPAVAKTRLNTLSYELRQYLNGVPISEIKLLSLRQQRAAGKEIVPII